MEDHDSAGGGADPASARAALENERLVERFLEIQDELTDAYKRTGLEACIDTDAALKLAREHGASETQALRETIASLNRALQAYGDGGIDGPSVRGFIDGALEEPEKVEAHAAGLAAALERERVLREEVGALREIAADGDRELARLRAMRCVVCQGQGWYAVPNKNTGDPEQEQCAACKGTGAMIDLFEQLREAESELTRLRAEADKLTLERDAAVASLAETQGVLRVARECHARAEVRLRAEVSAAREEERKRCVAFLRERERAARAFDEQFALHAHADEAHLKSCARVVEMEAELSRLRAEAERARELFERVVNPGAHRTGIFSDIRKHLDRAAPPTEARGPGGEEIEPMGEVRRTVESLRAIEKPGMPHNPLAYFERTEAGRVAGLIERLAQGVARARAEGVAEGLRLAAGYRPRPAFWICRECGANVGADEDGCCPGCGSNLVSSDDAADALAPGLRSLSPAPPAERPQMGETEADTLERAAEILAARGRPNGWAVGEIRRTLADLQRLAPAGSRQPGERQPNGPGTECNDAPTSEGASQDQGHAPSSSPASPAAEDRYEHCIRVVPDRYEPPLLCARRRGHAGDCSIERDAPAAEASAELQIAYWCALKEHAKCAAQGCDCQCHDSAPPARAAAETDDEPCAALCSRCGDMEAPLFKEGDGAWLCEQCRPAPSARSEPARADVFDAVALGWWNRGGGVAPSMRPALADYLRERFGPLVEAMERISDATSDLAEDWGRMRESVNADARAALAAVRQERTK